MKPMRFEPLCLAQEKDCPEFVHLGNSYLNSPDFMTLGHDSMVAQTNGLLNNGGLETRDRIEVLEEEAYEKGFAQGEKDGFEIGEKKAAKKAERLEAVLNQIQQLKQNLIKQTEKELLDMVFKIAEKVVHTQINYGTNAITDTIIHAIRIAAEKSRITLRVNPEDYEFVERLRPEIFSQFKELKTMTVNSDASVTRGGCLLETARGNVDASIETQLEKLSQAIEDAYLEEDAV